MASSTSAPGGSIQSSATTVAIAVTLSTAVLAPLVYSAIASSNKNRDKKLPPTVKDGRLHCLKTLAGPDIIEAFMKWANELGYPKAYYIPLLPSIPNCVVTDPELAREILTDKATKKTESYKKLGETLGQSFFTELDDVKWRHSRKGIAPAFSSAHIQRMNRVCEEHLEKWIKTRLEPMINNDEAFDPANEMLRMTVSIICEAAFDKIPTKEEISMYLEKNHDLLQEALKAMANPARGYFRNFFPDAKQAWESKRWVEEFGMSFLEAYRKNPNPTRGTAIDLIDGNPNYENDTYRVYDIAVLIGAGHDTSALTIAWALFTMAKHPKELEKLQAELKNIPESDWQTCSTFQNVVRESMRLNPVAAMGSARVAGRDFTSKDGSIFIPKGTGVILPQINLTRNPHIFEDPDEFRPDRWNDKNLESSIFFPFAMGPRNCVGQRLAVSETHTVLARLLGRYKFTLEQDYKPAFFVTYKPEGGKLKATRV